MTQEKKTFQQITSKNVCQIYRLLHKHKLVSFPITKDGENKVDALVSNINGTYFGFRVYSSSEEKAVAYLYFIIKDHPFVDGNKRTAVLIFSVVCMLNDLKPNYSDFGLDALAVYIESIKEQDHQRVIKILVDFIFN